MPLELWAIGLALVANIVVGTGLVLAGYRLMERRVVYGSVGGLLIGALIVYAEATIGAELFDLAFAEKRLLIVVAGIGAALGIIGTLSVVKPEIR